MGCVLDIERLEYRQLLDFVLLMHSGFGDHVMQKAGQFFERIFIIFEVDCTDTINHQLKLSRNDILQKFTQNFILHHQNKQIMNCDSAHLILLCSASA